MALEAVVFSQPQAAAGHFGYGRGDSTTYAVPWCDMLQGGLGGGGGFGDLCAAGEWDLDIDTWAAAAPTVELGGDDWDWEALSRDYQSSDASTEYHGGSRKAAAAPEPAGRRKRRRAKAVKNKEEIESQRMTHIAVERNRRRQMNEYLAVLRSLMPPSYAHRGDQASIVGGAINYVRELEQLLQSLEVQKSIRSRPGAGAAADSSPFAGFFSFPQYSATTSAHGGCSGNSNNTGSGGNRSDAAGAAAGAGAAGSAVADVEVTMVEGHASLKVLARRRPKQLLKLVAGLHQLRIPPLHLNVTTVDAMVLYTFSLKVEDDSNMGSVEDIAAAVHEIIGSIEQQQQEEEEEGETAVM